MCHLESSIQQLLSEFLVINTAFFKQQMGEVWELHLRALNAGLVVLGS